MIFCKVVVPTITFGCEVWVLTDKDDELILAFQRYAGKRVQRFPQRAPTSSSFYGLGWLKLTSYINIKKLLFVLTILKMVPENPLRMPAPVLFSIVEDVPLLRILRGPGMSDKNVRDGWDIHIAVAHC